jgi:hypothetical protein
LSSACRIVRTRTLADINRSYVTPAPWPLR